MGRMKAIWEWFVGVPKQLEQPPVVVPLVVASPHFGHVVTIESPSNCQSCGLSRVWWPKWPCTPDAVELNRKHLQERRDQDIKAVGNLEDFKKEASTFERVFDLENMKVTNPHIM